MGLPPLSATPSRPRAALVQKGLDRQLYAVGLERPQRTAILAVPVLEDPPAGLAELGGVLARDHRDRQ